MGCIGCLTSFCKNVDKGHTVGWERVVCEGRNRETYINDIFIISKMINLSVFCQNTAHMYKRCLLSLSLREMPSSYVIYKRMRGLIAPWLFFFCQSKSFSVFLFLYTAVYKYGVHHKNAMPLYSPPSLFAPSLSQHSSVNTNNLHATQHSVHRHFDNVNNEGAFLSFFERVTAHYEATLD